MHQATPDETEDQMSDDNEQIDVTLRREAVPSLSSPAYSRIHVAVVFKDAALDRDPGTLSTTATERMTALMERAVKLRGHIDAVLNNAEEIEAASRQLWEAEREATEAARYPHEAKMDAIAATVEDVGTFNALVVGGDISCILAHFDKASRHFVEDGHTRNWWGSLTLAQKRHLAEDYCRRHVSSPMAKESQKREECVVVPICRADCAEIVGMLPGINTISEAVLHIVGRYLAEHRAYTGEYPAEDEEAGTPVCDEHERWQEVAIELGDWAMEMTTAPSDEITPETILVGMEAAVMSPDYRKSTAATWWRAATDDQKKIAAAWYLQQLQTTREADDPD